jgi:serine-type D-Ala-D-Ala carboxypeptidase (penicillin-binding protein 5/6)
MRTNLAAVLIAASTLGLAVGASAAVGDPSVTAQAAVVMDARTGALLWSLNPDEPRPPASTTKILTTVLALESGRLEDTVAVSANAQAQVPSKLYLRAGQSAKLRDLLYALMLKSANDAAVVVAEGVSGSVEQFARRMTERARSLGARGSRFRNPSGLPDDEHVTTARDLGLILRHAVHVPGFVQVASVTKQRIPITVGARQQWMVVRTKNRLLQGYTVPVIGKTGYTRAAGRCYAGYAEKDGRSLIVVVLGSSDLWGDARALFDWGFDQSHETPLPVPVQVAARPVERVAWLPERESSPAPKHAELPVEPAVRVEARVAPHSAPVAASAIDKVSLPEAAPQPPTRATRLPAAPLLPARVASISEERPAFPLPREDRPSESAASPSSGRSQPATAAARQRSSSPVRTASKPAARDKRAKKEGRGRVNLAMGNGSSTSSGRTYYGEYRSRTGTVRRGCSGSGCDRGTASAGH